MPKSKELPIRREGDEIVIPDNVSVDDVIRTLTNQTEQDGDMTEIGRVFTCFPPDGFVAIWKAVKKVCGFSRSEPIEGIFGDILPEIHAITLPDGSKEYGISGPIGGPGIEGYIEAHPIQVWGSNQVGVSISGEVTQASLATIDKIFDEITRLLREESIYRGRAIAVSWDFWRQQRPWQVRADAPEFIATDDIDVSNLVLDDDMRDMLAVGLFSLFTHSEALKKAGENRKTGVMLAGAPGMGKSQTAWTTLKYAADAGWTTIYCKSAHDLPFAYAVASHYTPALVVAEDIDTEVSRRDLTSNFLLNQIDGIASKESEIVLLLTSNFPETCTAAFLRPGRIDTLVEYAAPSRSTVGQMIAKYSGIPEGADLAENRERLIDALMGLSPAAIRTVLNKAKRRALINDRAAPDALDVLTTTKSMKRHLEILAAAKAEPPADAKQDALKMLRAALR